MATKIIEPEVQGYLNHISSYDREFSKWEARVNKILKRYRDDSRSASDSGSRFNILWSNVQTLKAATFARLPQPDVSRRFRDNDPVGRVAALILERALDYEITHYRDYREALTSSIYDRFLGGRGVTWVRYEPKFKEVKLDELQITEDTENETTEELDYECAPCDYVHWKDFGHNIARTWEETSIVWRKVYMGKEQLEERFGEDAQGIPLDSEPEELKNASKEGVGKRALIYEIWDKDKGSAIWLSKSLGKILDERKDPLELEGFFPCPKPLYATLTNETLVPVPDFALYQDQAIALDNLSDKIDGLVKALQVKGVYDATEPTLARLFTEASNNQLIPVKNWNAFAEKQGLKGAIDMVDITPIARALNDAYNAFTQIKAQIYDITGISDIVRGQSNASETATAQQIKGQYASLRLKAYQDDVGRFAGDMLQLKAQIICKQFDDQTILMISGAEQLNDADKPFIQPALQLLRNEPMRGFRIEINSDSMVMQDEQAEKQARVEFLGAVGGFLEKAVQATQQAPQIATLVLDLLKYGVTGFKVGKTLEGEIDQTVDKIKQDMAQPKPPAPDPEQMKLQAQQQQHAQEQQADMQKFQMQQQAEQQTEALRIQHEKDMAMFQSHLDQQQALFNQAQERWALEFDARLKVMLAEISANATITAAQESAATQATETDNGE